MYFEYIKIIFYSILETLMFKFNTEMFWGYIKYLISNIIMYVNKLEIEVVS